MKGNISTFERKMAVIKYVKCKISDKLIPDSEAMPADVIKESVFANILKDFPDFSKEDYISLRELNKYRAIHAAELMAEDNPVLNAAEKEIVVSIENNELISKSPEEMNETLTLGQQLADKIATFGGSWNFIILFLSLLIIWMIINILISSPFDPFPFILLNLILSCIAALQAPVIMMSQNRKEQKDRQRSENDYKINLKAEIEIRQLHEKIDLLLMKFSEQNKQN